MSKISITPNTAGTGTFTITSPATNTDRTLTLPDTGGTVLTSASAIDAASLNGQVSSYYQPASTAITTANIGSQSVNYATDASYANNAGNATTATSLQTARTINGVSFNGTANITVADSTKAPIASPTFTGTVTGPTFNATSTAGGGFQGIDADSATVPSFTWTSDQNTGMWHLGADQIGFTTAGVNRLSLTTTALTSTLGITAPTFTGALTGNATTATTLQTARTIGGVSFNGSANINLPGVNTAGNQSTTGNAATATTLQTARTIALSGDVTGSVSFNGSANATISAQIAANVVGANELNVSGNGTTAQYLRSDGDGTFTWATPIAMGVGQTWQAVTRAAGTVYQNTTGRPIQLGINQYGLDGQLYIGLTSNPTQSIYWNNASGAGRYEQNHCNSIIPAGYYYKMTGAINGWNELR